MSIYFECRHIKASGEKCDSPAIRNTHFCYFHSRLKRLGNGLGPTPKNGIASGLVSIDSQPAAESALPENEPMDLLPLEDRSSVQVALSMVINSLASGKLDPKRAGLLLYGLQIASQNAARSYQIVSPSAVESVTRTANGQELGPSELYCDEPGDCVACTWRDGCESPDRDDIIEDDEENEGRS